MHVKDLLGTGPFHVEWEERMFGHKLDVSLPVFSPLMSGLQGEAGL